MPVRQARRLAALVVAALTLGACGSSPPRAVNLPEQPGSLKAPETTTAQDTAYVEGITRADPALATYLTRRGRTGVSALLADGVGFCAFLVRDGRIDGAMVDLGIAARGDESRTKLPLGITTFNAIDSLALITLCPDDQHLLPAGDRTRLAEEARALGLG